MQYFCCSVIRRPRAINTFMQVNQNEASQNTAQQMDLSHDLKTAKHDLAVRLSLLMVENEVEGLKQLDDFYARYKRSQTADPLISVLITSYQTAAYISACIHSMLMQTYSHIELVVVDDGSTDDTMAILGRIKDERLRVFHFSENKGRVAALNFGLSECRGEYIALMDSDDMASPLRLEMQLDYCVGQQVDAVSSQFLEFDDVDRSKRHRSNFSTNQQELKVKMLFYNGVPHAACLFRAACIKETGYREGFDFAEDYEMLSRFVARHSIGLIDEALYLYRRRGNSATNPANHLRSVDSRKKILKAFFEVNLFPITQEELDLHFNIESLIEYPVKTIGELVAIRKWMQKLIDHTHLKPVLDKKMLKKILLHGYWSKYYYNSRPLHGLALGLRLIPYQDFRINLLVLKESIRASVGGRDR